MSYIETAMYPDLKIDINKTPKKLYAIPIIGMLIKCVMLIPVFIVMMGLGLAYFVVTVLINPFVVLFTGKYWQTAYNLNIGMLRYSSKLLFFMYGLTDKYPGFNLEAEGFSLDMPLPQNPNRLFAIPILGGLVRMLLLIPFYIYLYVIDYAAKLGIALVNWIYVLFRGRYDEALYEFGRDSTRLSMSLSAYMSGLSDKYPSFEISWNHKRSKIILIVVALVFIVINMLIPEDEPKVDSYQNSYPSQDQIQIQDIDNIAPETYTQ